MSGDWAREPAVCGRFYPADPEELRTSVSAYIGESSGAQEAIAVVAPHAGHIYSGRVAGAAYAAVRVPDSVIVFCPNHTGAGARTSIISAGRFRMPSGDVSIHEKLAELLRDRGSLVEDTRAHAREHAIEVHLPFLTERCPSVRLVPVCLGGLSRQDCEKLGAAVGEVVRGFGESVLLVASTDMSHYVPATTAAALDRLAIDRILALDPPGLYETVVSKDISMCGFIPTTVVLAAAKSLGATRARLMRYGHSGETNGDDDHVVGYASLVID